jgi:large subunit ribosomal protein L27
MRGRDKEEADDKPIEQYVIPGNIIFRQRGTHWFPGENCAMGRDHTIYATESGYVKYYKDPEKNPKRQYIGVVFERHHTLPLPRNSARRRRLGMVAKTIEAAPIEAAPIEAPIAAVTELDADSERAVEKKRSKRGKEERTLELKDGYMYREANWEIGRAAEKANIRVRKFKPGDRWVAWKKKAARIEKAAEKRRLGGKKSKKQSA